MWVFRIQRTAWVRRVQDMLELQLPVRASPHRLGQIRRSPCLSPRRPACCTGSTWPAAGVPHPRAQCRSPSAEPCPSLAWLPQGPKWCTPRRGRIRPWRGVQQSLATGRGRWHYPAGWEDPGPVAPVTCRVPSGSSWGQDPAGEPAAATTRRNPRLAPRRPRPSPRRRPRPGRPSSGRRSPSCG